MTRTLFRLSCGALQRPLVCRHRPRPLRLDQPRISQPLRSISAMDASSKMLRSNRLKQVFDEGQRPAMGFWQMLPGANISRILARSGPDWVMVDCEHGNIDGREPFPGSTAQGSFVVNTSYRRRLIGLSIPSQTLQCTKRFLPLLLWASPRSFASQIFSLGW